MPGSTEEKNSTLTAEDLGLGSLDQDPVDVHDLPQLYSKPRAAALLSTLADLSCEPRSWDSTPQLGTPRTPQTPLSGAASPLRRKLKVRSEGVPSYLTRIISSSLAWIEDDEQKEKIWEAASQRLSERSGRSAMTAFDRTFVIPLHTFTSTTFNRNPSAVSDASDLPQSVEMTLRVHEPALTADNLGFKTWASSFLLARRMASLHSVLPKLPEEAMLLELGSGTGLVGFSAAAALKAHVIVTDLAEIVPNLERNAQTNAATIAEHGGKTTVAVLDWAQPGAFQLDGIDGGAPAFPLILAADPIYSPEHPTLLVQAIAHHLTRDISARVVVEMPLRDSYNAERADFRARMEAIGLIIHQEGEETGFDDWSSTDEDLVEVRCWWSVWAWR